MTRATHVPIAPQRTRTSGPSDEGAPRTAGHATRIARSLLTPSRILLLLFVWEMSSPCRRADPAKLVVGIQSEAMPDIVAALHVVIRVAGTVALDETMRPPSGARGGFFSPWERALTAPGGQPGAPVDVVIEAGGPASAAPLFTRLASTHFVPGHVQLLRIVLESRCIVYPPVRDQPAGPRPATVPGPLSGPTCAAPTTCIQGTCRSPVVSPENLETYAANWPTNAPDRCKPARGGTPVVQIGTGQTDYLPLASGQMLQAEAGPQGGHHIWIATRMKNLKQRLTTTRIEGVQPETHTTIPPTTFVFTYAPDEGDYCKLYGLRYQLDNGGIDYKQFLGKPLDVVVTVTDQSGASAASTAQIQVAPTLVNSP